MAAKVHALAWVHEFFYAWRGNLSFVLTNEMSTYPYRNEQWRCGKLHNANIFSLFTKKRRNKIIPSNKTSLQEQPPALRRCLNQRLCSAITHFNCYTPFPPPSSPPSARHKIFSALPVFSPSVSYSSICFQSSAACSSIHPPLHHP